MFQAELFAKVNCWENNIPSFLLCPAKCKFSRLSISTCFLKIWVNCWVSGFGFRGWGPGIRVQSFKLEFRVEGFEKMYVGFGKVWPGLEKSVKTLVFLKVSQSAQRQKEMPMQST